MRLDTVCAVQPYQIHRLPSGDTSLITNQAQAQNDAHSSGIRFIANCQLAVADITATETDSLKIACEYIVHSDEFQVDWLCECCVRKRNVKFELFHGQTKSDANEL